MSQHETIQSLLGQGLTELNLEMLRFAGWILSTYYPGLSEEEYTRKLLAMGKGPKQFRSPTIDLQKTIGIWTDFLNSQQYDSYFKDVQKFKNYVFRIRDIRNDWAHQSISSVEDCFTIFCTLEKFLVDLKGISLGNHSKFISLDHIRQYKLECQIQMSISLLTNQTSLQMILKKLTEEYQRTQSQAEQAIMEKQRMLEQEAQFHASKQKQEPLINLLKSMVTTQNSLAQPIAQPMAQLQPIVTQSNFQTPTISSHQTLATGVHPGVHQPLTTGVPLSSILPQMHSNSIPTTAVNISSALQPSLQSLSQQPSLQPSLQSLSQQPSVLSAGYSNLSPEQIQYQQQLLYQQQQQQQLYQMQHQQTLLQQQHHQQLLNQQRQQFPNQDTMES